MTKIKCLEYYFKPEATTQQIEKEIDDNIKILHKISKIIDVRKEISTNNSGMKVVHVYITQKVKDRKDKVDKKIRVNKKVRKNLKKIKEKEKKDKKIKEKKVTVIERTKSDRKRTQILKTPQKKKEKIEPQKTQINPVVKVELELPVKQYGQYKQGGKFKPYEAKNKKSLADKILNKIKPK